jgi:N-sulfoglucosamine sulfohydrolase
MMNVILKMKDKGQLNEQQMLWFRPNKPVEELYDCEADPWQFKNLAGDPAHTSKLAELRTACDEWIREVGDLSAEPEMQMLRTWWNGRDHAPTTEAPEVIRQGTTIKLSSATAGASIGYKFKGKDAWSVYTGPIKPNGQDSLYVIAQRIGYYKSEVRIEWIGRK